MKSNLTNRLVKTALVTAIYAIVTIILAPISYGNIQFRLSEILVLLAFIDPIYIIGLTLGCFLANLYSAFGILDVIFGTLATFLSVSAMSLTAKYMNKGRISLFIASLWPTIFNGIIIGWMLNIVANLPLFLTMTEVAIGEFVVVTIIGVPVMSKLFKKYSSRLMHNV